MRVLITYGSRMGGTAGIAKRLGFELGVDEDLVVVANAGAMPSPEIYDAVIIGGAVYEGRWHRQARRYVRRYRRLLGSKLVWLFESGPLDDSALGHLEPSHDVAKAMELVGAVGHMTFGGRLEPDASWPAARKMARRISGDWRDPNHISQWARQIADLLQVRIAA